LIGIPSLPRKWVNLIPASAVAFVNCIGDGRVVCARDCALKINPAAIIAEKQAEE
jgi:hypothetical protein